MKITKRELKEMIKQAVNEALKGTRKSRIKGLKEFYDTPSSMDISRQAWGYYADFDYIINTALDAGRDIGFIYDFFQKEGVIDSSERDYDALVNKLMDLELYDTKKLLTVLRNFCDKYDYLLDE